MATYDLKQVVKLWETERLTAEQVIGQILLHLEALAERVGELEKRLERARQEKK